MFTLPRGECWGLFIHRELLINVLIILLSQIALFRPCVCCLLCLPPPPFAPATLLRVCVYVTCLHTRLVVDCVRYAWYVWRGELFSAGRRAVWCVWERDFLSTYPCRAVAPVKIVRKELGVALRQSNFAHNVWRLIFTQSTHEGIISFKPLTEWSG